jgi:hypothetical protein
MTTIRLILTTLSNVLGSLWKNLSPFFLVVTSGFGTWHIAQAYFFSRYAELPPPSGNSELIFYMSLALPVFLLAGTIRYFADEEARKR